METLKINFEKKIPLIFEKNHTTVFQKGSCHTNETARTFEKGVS